MIKKALKLCNVKLLHFSIVASLYAINPAHAGHLQKILPAKQLKKIQHEYDQETAERFNSWQSLLLDSHNKTSTEKLTLVNDFFNQMKWTEDQNLWQKRDYWATPIESLIRNAGDCEDFSIAKYFTLLELGIPVEQLKVSYVQMRQTQQAHMVLAFYESEGADPLILDNMQKKIMRGSKRTDLAPMFHFNGEGVWSKDSPSTRVDSALKIRNWADLMQRIDAEQS